MVEKRKKEKEKEKEKEAYKQCKMSNNCENIVRI